MSKDIHKLIGSEFDKDGEQSGVDAGRFELKDGLYRPKEAQRPPIAIAVANGGGVGRFSLLSRVLGGGDYDELPIKKIALAATAGLLAIAGWTSNYQHDQVERGTIKAERWRVSTPLPLTDNKLVIGATRRFSGYNRVGKTSETSSFNFEGPTIRSSSEEQRFHKNWLKGYAGGQATPQ